MEKKNNLKRVLILFCILAVLLIAFYAVTGAISKFTGFSIFNDKDDFSTCLKENDITLFINSETPSETLNKIILKDYLKDIKIMNCLRDNQACIEKGVDSFPSWMINKELIKKDISFLELAESSGCPISIEGGKDGFS